MQFAKQPTSSINLGRYNLGLSGSVKDKVAARFEKWWATREEHTRLDEAARARGLEAFRAGYSARDAVLSGQGRER